LNLLSRVVANARFWESLRFLLPRSGHSRLAAEGQMTTFGRLRGGAAGQAFPE
jgi:hypothetical protein